MSLSDQQRAVVLVAEGLARSAEQSRRWWQRKLVPMDFVSVAREAVAILLLLPEGQTLTRRILTEHFYLSRSR